MLPVDIVDAAKKKDAEIISVLKTGKSFCVEAGAGAGKTYSLNIVIDWLRDNKAKSYTRNGMQVICITFTNAAVNVIASRLKDTSFIVPSTIHGFAWGAIAQFQYEITKLIGEDKEYFNMSQEDVNSLEEIRYTLGNRIFDNKTLYLYHDDVLKLFIKMLDKKEYRDWFSRVYPLILIDEYQDTRDDIVQQFIKYFINKKEGPQIGFFGDSWQTIFQMNKPCGTIESKNIRRINKHINFRSAKEVVNVLNKMRSDLIQISANEEIEGTVKVILCDDFVGVRSNERNFKGDLPIDEFNKRVNVVEEIIRCNYQMPHESMKTLMLTNRLLAIYQEYDEVFEELGSTIFREESDPIYQFFKLKIEPMRRALNNDDICALMEVLGSNFPPISSKDDKERWILLKEALMGAETKTAYEVISAIVELRDIIPIPRDVLRVLELFRMYKEEIGSEEIEHIKRYLSIKYKQFINAINYFEPTSMFSTEHGSKGEEYDNVLFVISKGWSFYQFDKYLPHRNESSKEYIRNRNLFYVSCSRAKRNLFLLITYPIDDAFRTYLDQVFGHKNIIQYDEFVRLQK